MEDEILDEIRKQVVSELIVKTPWISEEEFEFESQTLRNLSAGLGPFTEIIKNEKFTDLFINAQKESWIKRGATLERIQFSNDERMLVNFIRSQALRVGKHFDRAHPAVDLELGEGIRLHALLPPLVEHGIHVSLRVSQQRELQNFDELFQQIIESIIESKENFLISGGTGSGKTTLLSEIINHLPSDQRILVIEDTREISSMHPHVLRLQARESNSEGVGAFSVRDLIHQALRMKPDRIFLGEVRGADILDLFLALNTGHEGSGGTIHVNSPVDVPNRVAALSMMAGIPREAALELFASAINLIIHLDGSRAGNRISSISRVRSEGNNVVLNELVHLKRELKISDVEALQDCLRR